MTNRDGNGELLNKGETARFLGRSRWTVDRWVAADILPSPVEVHGRQYWTRNHLSLWTAWSCPSRRRFETRLRLHEDQTTRKTR